MLTLVSHQNPARWAREVGAERLSFPGVWTWSDGAKRHLCDAGCVEQGRGMFETVAQFSDVACWSWLFRWFYGLGNSYEVWCQVCVTCYRLLPACSCHSGLQVALSQLRDVYWAMRRFYRNAGKRNRKDRNERMQHIHTECYIVFLKNLPKCQFWRNLELKENSREMRNAKKCRES